MSTTFGGCLPGFNFTPTVSPAQLKFVTGNISGFITGSGSDALIVTGFYSGAYSGTSYTVSINSSIVNYGIPPQIIYTSSNTGVAVVNQQGVTSYVSTGNFNLIVTALPTPFFNGYSYSIPLKTIQQGGTSSYSVQYNRTADTASNVLIVYNQASTQSSILKTYYTGHRPLFSGANVLGISGDVGEFTTYLNYKQQIESPINSWITGNSSKVIRYIVLMMDVPIRTVDNNSYSVSHWLNQSLLNNSLRSGQVWSYSTGNHFTIAQYPGTTALVTHLSMGTSGDVKAYIDKLATFGNTYSSGNIVIQPSSGGYANTNYIMDMLGYAGQSLFEQSYVALFSGVSGFPSPQFPISSVYLNFNQNAHIYSGNNLAGYMSWGANGGLGASYSLDGTVKFGNNSNWYLVDTWESFNGQRNGAGFQGHYTQWFSTGSWGGTGYEKTAVGAVGHTEEPNLVGLNSPYFMGLWQAGFNFAECAWGSKSTPYFLAVGDPLIQR